MGSPSRAAYQRPYLAAAALCGGLALLVLASLRSLPHAPLLIALGGFGVGIGAARLLIGSIRRSTPPPLTQRRQEEQVGSEGVSVILGAGLEVYLLKLIRRPALQVDASLRITDLNLAAREFLAVAPGMSPPLTLESLGSSPLSEAIANALPRPGAEISLGANLGFSPVPVPVRCEGVTFKTAGGDTGAILVLTDLRPDRAISDKIERGNELALIGQSIASSAHEIKNVLTGVEGGGALIHLGLERQRLGLVEKGWHMAEKNLALIKKLVYDILALSRESPLQFAEDRLERAAIEAVKETQVLAKAQAVDLVFEPDPTAQAFSFCKKSVVQCAINLISNAISACSTLPPGRERRVLVQTGSKPTGEFFLSVSDSGPGIPQEALPKILEGFRSTKGSGGTGLGLLVIQKIVKAHGGRLEVVSGEGHGATFTLVFPPVPSAC
jgi:signal transduction histidine kinase